MFKNLDYSQRKKTYKIAFETLIFQSVFIVIVSFLESTGIDYFNSVTGNYYILFCTLWFFMIRRTMESCRRPSEERAYQSYLSFFTSIVCTIILVWKVKSEGFLYVNSFGTIHNDIILFSFVVALWTIWIVEYLQRKRKQGGNDL